MLEHGGSFIVASDYGETVWTFDDDSEIYSVMHVLAIIPGKDGGGPVIRDVFGDRTCSPKDLKAEMAERFDVWEGDVLIEEMTAEDLLFLMDDPAGVFQRSFGVSEDPDLEHERPLCEFFEGDIAETRLLDLVLAEPGTRELMPIEPVRHDEDAVPEAQP